jgi:heme/copper-type cytochrome/quinol oxidase subunit 2
MSLRPWLGVALVLLGFATSAGPALTAQPRSSPEHIFAISAKRYAFSPNRIEVTEGDLVRIELRSEDIAHSLTIDSYRLAKRVEAGQPVVLEFRAERAGTFPFYCNLQIDEGCRRMRGELVVRPPRTPGTGRN